MKPIRRLLFIAPLLALPGCATTDVSSSRAELAELKAEVRAVRAENARLTDRLQRAELERALQTVNPSVPAPSTTQRPDELPVLTVVKLKPRADPAPRLATAVAVVEPDPAVIDDLLEAPPRADPEPGEEALPLEVGEAMFEQGVAALRTGNLEGGVLKLQTFSAEQPRHPKADNALYYAGVGLAGLGDHEGAVQAFERLIAEYPAGDAVAEALLKLGESRARLRQPQRAKQAYERLLGAYPGTAAATLAQQRLSALVALEGSTHAGSP